MPSDSNAMNDETGAGLIGVLSLTITICLAPAIRAVVDSIRNPKHGHDDHLMPCRHATLTDLRGSVQQKVSHRLASLDSRKWRVRCQDRTC